MNVYIGTSGWQYDNWKEDFYSQSLEKEEWLSFYSKKFETVEVNASFYGSIKPETYKKWLRNVNDNFIFSIKANRYITHLKRLKDIKASTKKFWDNIEPLRRNKNTHAILWQLRPDMKYNSERFEKLIEILPNGFLHAFEFRHDSWVNKEVYKMVEKSKAKTCIVIQDWKEWPELDKPVGDFVYIRLHGKNKLYTSNYSDKELEVWAKRMREWSRQRKIFAYFNNDAKGYAPKNAQFLKNLLK